MSVAVDIHAVLRAQLDEIVRTVGSTWSAPARGPVVATVEYTIDHDWSRDEAIHFRVVLRDPVGRDEYDWPELQPVENQIMELIREHGIERLPYVDWADESNLAAIAEGRYDADADEV